MATRTVEETPSVAEDAVSYILRRVVTDRDFSWLMMGTETLRLCIEAEAFRAGVQPSDVESKLHQTMEAEQARLSMLGRDKPQVVVFRERLEQIADWLQEQDSRGQIDRETCASLRNLVAEF